MQFRAILFAALVVIAPASLAQAAAGDVHPCDEAAAHRSDPNRMASGLAMDQIVPRLAVTACEAAVAEYPEEARFHYQLGRAYAAAERTDDAVASYQKAASLDYPMAFFNLGVAAKDAGNYEAAEGFLKTALGKGIKVAADTLASIVFTGEGFSNPQFFEAVYQRKLQGSGPILYVANFLQIFNNTPGCQKVATNGITVRAAQAAQRAAMGQLFGALKNAPRDGTFEGAGRGGAQAGQALALSLAMQVNSVQDDANLFYSRYDCNTPIAIEFFDSLGDWVFDL